MDKIMFYIGIERHREGMVLFYLNILKHSKESKIEITLLVSLSCKNLPTNNTCKDILMKCVLKCVNNSE